MLPILNQSLWRDEAFSTLLSLKSPMQIISLSAQDQTPPLFALLLHYWMLVFGTTETSLRGLPFLFHLGTTGVVFFLIQKLTKTTKAAMLVAFATLLNPFLLEYAFEVRTYSLLAFLVILSILCISYKKYILASICLALALFSHNFALFSFVAVGIWWIYTKRKYIFIELKQTLQLFVIPVITFLGWSVVLWNQWVRVGHGFWIKPVQSTALLETFQKFATSDLSYPSSGYIFVATVVITVVALTYWLWKQKEEASKVLTLLALSILLPISIVYGISLLFAPIYLERYLIAVLPPAITFIGYSLWRFIAENPSKKIFSIVLISIYTLLLLQSTQQLLQMSSKPAINWAVSQILTQAKPEDVIVPKDVLNYLETKWYVEQAGSTIPVYAYAPKGTVPFYIGSVLYDKKNIIKTLPKNKRIWQVEPNGGYMLLVPK